MPIHIEVVTAQKQRLRASPRVPSPRQFSESRVLANPVEVDPQSLGELRQWPRKSYPAVEPDELQTSELFGDVVFRNWLEDSRQEPLR